MNPKKFAFIICTNNQLFLNECISYINLLDIPSGYEVEMLFIEDASCMTSGYNEGLASTDAKYKIYMHQDVFILNRFILHDILEIFASDLSIGMIGMIGYEKIPYTGTMWHEQRFGSIKLFGTKRKYPESFYSISDITSYKYNFMRDGITDVSLVDGLMMVTQYDLPWNEKVLDAWDFYDAFQSVNFLEHNYRIVVPNQDFPWIIHDDGLVLSFWNYNKYRKLFLETYKAYLGHTSFEIREMQKNRQS